MKAGVGSPRASPLLGPPPIATRRVASGVVGWAMRPDGRAELGVDALEMAVWRRRHSALGYLSPGGVRKEVVSES